MSKNKNYRNFAVTTMAAAAAVASVAPVVASAEETVNFPDVNDKTVPTKTTQDSIYKLVDKGAIRGFPDGTFKPGTNVQRGQVAEMVTKALDIEIPSNVDDVNSKYKDADKFFDKADYIAAASEAEIFTGQLNGNFDAWSTISRQQMATVLGDYLTSQGFESDGSVDVNLTKVSESHKAGVQLLADLGITTETDDFRAYDPVSRAQFSAFLVRTLDTIEAEKNKAPSIESVSAINSKEVKVTLSGDTEGLTASDFNVTGDLSVVDVAVSGKTATITFNKAMTDGAEYTLQMVDENDEVTSSADFKYELGAVAEISLTKSVFEEGEKVTDSLKVFDENGIEISTADYNVVNVESSNTNVVDHDTVGTVLGTGTSNLRFEIEYKDGSKSKSDFIRVDVEKAVTAELAGFELDAATANFENTADYRLGGAAAKTSFSESDIGTPEYMFVYADDSKDNPEISELDLSTGGDYTVTSKTPTVITVSQDGTGASLTPISVGKANIQVEGPNNYKKTVTVEVKEDSVYEDLALGATSVKLSDETKSGSNELGVNQDLVTLEWLDQFGDRDDFDYTTPDGGNATNPTEKIFTDVLEPGDKLVVSAAQTNGAFEISDVNASGIEITAVQGKTVNNASIRVSYYEDGSANTFTTQKIISTTVVDVDGSDDVYEYETLLDFPAITADTLVDTATVNAFGLDEDGNRLSAIDATDIELTATESVSDDEEEWFDIGGAGNSSAATNEVTFEPDAEKFLADSGEVQLYYTIDNASNPHGTVTVAYDNAFKAPAEATVNNKPVLIHANDGFDDGSGNVEATVAELLFGKINEDELVIDNAGSAPAGTKPSIAVKKGQDGYSNKAILNLLDNEGTSIVSGAHLYGLDVDAAAETNGNGYLIDTPSTGAYDADTEFEVEYSITNASKLTETNGGVNDLSNTLTIASDDQAEFTIVITKVSVAATGATGNYQSQVQDNNLLDAPKSVNVILNQ